jgi:hypothetical protein
MVWRGAASYCLCGVPGAIREPIACRGAACGVPGAIREPVAQVRRKRRPYLLPVRRPYPSGLCLNRNQTQAKVTSELDGIRIAASNGFMWPASAMATTARL